MSRNNFSEENDVFPSVTVHRLQNAKNATIDALNVNSLRNKIGAVDELITDNIEICLLSETKIDENFPNQFNISNYKTFRRHRNKHGGGLLFCINGNITRKLIKTMKLFQMILKFWLKLENGFVMVFINHHPKTKIISLIFFLKL